jgi:hypothetical protein
MGSSTRYLHVYIYDLYTENTQHTTHNTQHTEMVLVYDIHICCKDTEHKARLHSSYERDRDTESKPNSQAK